MSEKVIERKRLDTITKDGEKGFFVPNEAFHGENCIIIISINGTRTEPIEKIISKAENNIFVYASNSSNVKSFRRNLRENDNELKVVEHKSPLFKSINKALDEVIAHRASKKRPKTLEAFLDEL